MDIIENQTERNMGAKHHRSTGETAELSITTSSFKPAKALQIKPPEYLATNLGKNQVVKVHYRTPIVATFMIK